ncbi:hypothetical protein K2173_015632 [Erythroxylum novogranatense]|uniref:Protein BIG GRAIN 1-like A n=1 Tax=Erythroxylum novogranatense TaxID=1862640 RepID=A0AAV8SE11_9ROSI|nr:hypothetical protein K2173_015632 [Erythroxylum novogranatense]
MYRSEKEAKTERYKVQCKIPSFSSSLLDEIYRSIDEGNEKRKDLRFYRETVEMKQTEATHTSARNNRAIAQEEEVSALRRACLIEKWMDQKVSTQRTRPNFGEFQRKSHHHDHEPDQDVLFFSTTSSSSDSSSGGLSSSDSDSLYGARSIALSRLRPVRTSLSVLPLKAEKTERTRRTVLYEQREFHMIDDFHYPSADDTPRLEKSSVSSKSRALEIYRNLKKMKQPISPGAKFASFINSLFTATNIKKSKRSSSSVSSVGNSHEQRKYKTGQESTCSSASSFTRSCLSKSSPSTRERLRNGVKRTVRFYPVSVIVDEDCKPCGHKSLNEQGYDTEPKLMPVTLPSAWKIGKSPSRKVDHEIMEKSIRVEDVARELLKDYHHQQKKNELIMRDVRRNYNGNYEDDDDEYDDDDDAASYSSSDLFELDHLSVIGKERYNEELPVYETTHVDKNRAIASGLIM